ncbi:MAG: DHH family phosphoesterase [Thermoprotei archaeon]
MLINNKTALINWIINTDAHRILITGHANADPDAVASALGLKELITKIKSSTIIIDITFPEGISESSSRVLESLNFLDAITSVEPNHDCYILVDTSTPEQLGELGKKILESKKPIIIIDHHKILPSDKITIVYADENSPSSTELVYDLFREFLLIPSQKIAQLLLTAIIYETRRFTFARTLTFKTVIDLIQAGADYNLAQDLIKLEMDYSEKIARLKAASRIRVYSVDKKIIAITWIGAFEASVAKSLIDLGADVVFVLNTDDNVVSRISARSKSNIEIDLSEIMIKIARKFSGIGGGHKNAAGAHLKGESELITREILKELETKMGKLKRLI